MTYDRIKKKHDKFIARYSQGVITYSVTTTVPGEFEWSPPTQVTVEEPLQGVVHGVAAEFVDNTNIVASDLVVHTAVPSEVPEVGDTIKIDGKPAVVLQVRNIPGAGPAAAIRMIVRG